MRLPSWAVVSPPRRAHIERVARLTEQWNEALGIAPPERQRRLRAVALHDALKDAPTSHLRRIAPDQWGVAALLHGPAAAACAARHGESDKGVLDAVRYHSVGYAGWDDVGRMLYLADYLEPGRDFLGADRRMLAERVPRDVDGVLCEVARRRIAAIRESGLEPLHETVAFWAALRCDG